MIDLSLFKNIAEITVTDSAKKYQSAQAMPLLEISTELCQATISLYGGQILEFTAHNKSPLLWLSPLVKFESGVPIRGGIPICAPWFGKHHNSAYPNHGFARTSEWQLSHCEVLANQAIKITLSLRQSARTAALGYSDFEMSISFILGQELALEFSMTNHSDTAIDCGWAWHSYFNVNDIAAVAVTGLAGYQYIDAVQGEITNQLEHQQRFKGEVDRYFVNASAEQTIECAQPITLTGQNCNTVITWNPGAPLAEKMHDIGAANFDRFVCVERGSAFSDSWLIGPKDTETATLVISQLF